MSDLNDFDEPSMVTMRGDAQAYVLGRIDQYDIIRKLGGGGFGVVYLVKDTLSNVEYAIKTLHPLLKSNLEEMDNLKTQFSLVSKLSHTNIASAMYLHPIREVVYTSEEVRRDLRLSPGDFVMVMKYAPGVTLSKWRKQFANGIVPVETSINVCKQIASALDYAHSEMIIHRDIKPGNIMVETRDNGSIFARVLDFGLAAEIRSSMSRVSTDKGDTSGTRPYMAPEQWQGKRQGAGTDQYALACLFYDLVAGAVPFAGAFETGDMFVMLNSVKTETPENIDVLSEQQNSALQKALAKDSKDRFPDCITFINALSGIIPSSITTPSKSEEKITDKIICKECKSENSVNATFCSVCGAKLERDDICLKCKSKLTLSQKFCDKCGAKTPRYIMELARAERIAIQEKIAARENPKVTLQTDLFNASKNAISVAVDSISKFTSSAIGSATSLQKKGETTTDKLICKKCKQENSVDATFCSGCGAKIERDDECLKCKSKLTLSQKFCDKCGAKTPRYIAELARAERVAIQEKIIAREQAERKAREEAERKAREEAERKAREEAERKAREEANRKAYEKLEKNFNVAGIEIIRLPDSDTHKNLYFGKYQITQAQWYEIMGNNPSHFKGEASRPVECVSWNDAQVFLKRLNSRPDVKQSEFEFYLPSIEEWKYACRAGGAGKYGLLASGREGKIENMGWYVVNSGGIFSMKTHPVGQFLSNAWGLYDMHGNVWEWTTDIGDKGYFLCGGCYSGSFSDCDVYGRIQRSPDSRLDTIGFRVIARINPEKNNSINQEDIEEQSINDSIDFVSKSFSVAGIEIIKLPDSVAHKGLYFGKYQITQAQWCEIMGNNPSHFKGEASCPVEQVSFFDCMEFVEKFNSLDEVRQSGFEFFIPTEFEWEYACRAGSVGKYGLLANGIEGMIDEMGWYVVNSGGFFSMKTHPVGQLLSNAWGLYDMHGNVWEWTTSSLGKRQVLCGGGYYSSASDCEAKDRCKRSSDSKSDDIGLRLAARIKI